MITVVEIVAVDVISAVAAVVDIALIKSLMSHLKIPTLEESCALNCPFYCLVKC